jgi:hypothetical protein
MSKDELEKLSKDELINLYWELKKECDYNNEVGIWDGSYEKFMLVCQELEKRGVVEWN